MTYSMRRSTPRYPAYAISSSTTNAPTFPLAKASTAIPAPAVSIVQNTTLTSQSQNAITVPSVGVQYGA